ADRLGEGRLNLLQIRNVRCQSCRQIGQLLLDLLVCLVVTIEDTDCGALFEKPVGSCGADTAGASSDQDTLVLEAAHEERIINGELTHALARGRSCSRRIPRRPREDTRSSG